MPRTGRCQAYYILKIQCTPPLKKHKNFTFQQKILTFKQKSDANLRGFLLEREYRHRLAPPHAMTILPE